VTTGVGTSILPLRLGVAPEIALLSLESEPASLGAGPDRR
jgi:predicted MPP superfamily phosphohydrolase